MIMKRLMIALTALLATALSANAMSYEKAREQALFLTDKMAYELNLSDDQYEAAYEVNLDYLMSINSYDDLYGAYWRNRNLDMSYILLDWQYRAFCAASYFYRPLYWRAGVWHFGIYARYPRRNYFYFGRPHFYVSYRGGHSWRSNGGRSWYHGRTFGKPHREGGHGMRDRFDRDNHRRNGEGHFNNNRRPDGNRHYDNGQRNDRQTGGKFGNNRGGNSTSGRPGRNFGNRGSRVTERESSTRTTVTNNNRTRNFGNVRESNVAGSRTTRPAGTFTPRGGSSSTSRISGSSHGAGRSVSGGGSRSAGAGNRAGGHFGGQR